MPAVLRTRTRLQSAEAEDVVSSKSSSPGVGRGRKGRKRGRRRLEENDSEHGSDYNDGEDWPFSGAGGGGERSALQHGRPFELVAGLPSTLEVPEYNSTLGHPLSIKNSAVLYQSLVSSRRAWVLGEMFEPYWTKPKIKPMKQEDTKNEGGSPFVRDRMQKMCDCEMFAGPHSFPIRLFILKNEKIERKWQAEQEVKKMEKEAKKKKDQEDKLKKSEERKHQQQLKKQERERKAQLQKDTKAKNKLEQERLKSQKKEELKRLKEKQKTTAKANSPKSSVSDSKMIANLNRMAQKDPSLNALMSKVAKGHATVKEVEEFKKFIEIAKKMPPPPGWGAKKASLDENTSVTSINQKEAVPDEKEQSLGKCNDSKDPSTSVETHDTSPIKNGKVSDPSTRAVTKPASKRANAKEEEDKSMQLTAFQQKYIENADISIEFQEYANTRYLLPKDIIVEHMEDSGDFLISWILVHNSKEIKRYEQQRIKEITKDMDNEVTKDEKVNAYNVYEEEDCPEPLFTSLTIRLAGIHKKYAPIIINSSNPLEIVQKRMESILRRGTRLSGYNLWYQLDGFDDKDLAESIRSGLNEYENGLKSKRHRRT